LKTWLEKTLVQVPGRSNIAKAIRYALKQHALGSRVTDHGTEAPITLLPPYRHLCRSILRHPDRQLRQRAIQPADNQSDFITTPIMPGSNHYRLPPPQRG